MGPIAVEPLSVCPACETTFHEGCIAELAHGRCPTVGCGRRRRLPAETEARPRARKASPWFSSQPYEPVRVAAPAPVGAAPIDVPAMGLLELAAWLVAWVVGLSVATMALCLYLLEVLR